MINKERIWEKRLVWLAFFSLLWLLMTLSAVSCLDPDFGWHLRNGQWVWQNQAVPKTDLFSYSMPDFPWVAHAWSLDALLYLGQRHFGFGFLSLVAGFFGALTFMLLVNARQIKQAFFPLVLVVLAGIEYINVRPRVISFFLTVLLFLFLKKSFKKAVWLIPIPLLFWFWANLHAGFSLGFILVLSALLLNLFFGLKGEKGAMKLAVSLVGVLFISFVLTLINPYGQDIYRLLYEEMVAGQKAHYQIAEWKPYASFNLPMLFYTGFFLALVAAFIPFELPGLGKPILFNKRFLKVSPKEFWYQEKVYEVLLALLFLVAGFISRRLMIYFFLLSLPVSIYMLKNIYELLKGEKIFQRIWSWWLFYLFLFVMLSLLVLKSFYRSVDLFSEANYYPVQAVDYLHKAKFSGNLYSTYNWGGYLVWKLPEKKVFIDGRMAIWRQDDYSAFDQQVEIETGELDYHEVFDQYQVSHVLLPVDQVRSSAVFPLLLGVIGVKEDGSSLAKTLFLEGWQIVYQDETALVMVKNRKG